MKKIVLIIILLINFQAIAISRFYDEDEDCDACGCSANGGSLGFSSLLNKNFVGVRYFHQSYSSKDGLYNNSPWVKERFNTVQLWSKIPIAKRFQLVAIVPFQFHNNDKSSGAQAITGIGDISVAGTYTLLEKFSEESFSHNLEIGAGLKLPTGKYDATINGTVNPSFQVGTGSYDALLLLEYTMFKEKFGWNTALSYNLKSENKEKYQFGDQFNYSSALFYTTNINNMKLIPQLGISGEVFQKNKQFGETLRDTKGDVLFTKIGLEIGINKLGIGISGMLPISQNLTGRKVESNYRLSLNLNYNI